MEDSESQTRLLLQRWYDGDEEALSSLLKRNLPWLRAHVRRRLGAHLRKRAETADFVQDAALELLQYGPKFLVANEKQFRALVGRIVENVLRDRNDWFNARRRAAERERPLPRDSILDLDPGQGVVDRPSEIAQRRESEAWARLGLRLLDPESQQVIVLRQFEGLSFAKVGEQMGITEDAARMRFARALGKLGQTVRRLQQGQIDAAATDDEPDPGD